MRQKLGEEKAGGILVPGEIELPRKMDGVFGQVPGLQLIFHQVTGLKSGRRLPQIFDGIHY